MRDFQPTAKVIADSINSRGNRLTTMEVTLHRFMLPEFNTHRQFCLAGDAVLEFDLPAGGPRSRHRVHRVRLDDFVDRWHNGARRTGAHQKTQYDLSWVDPSRHYTAQEVAGKLGMAYHHNVNTAARKGNVEAYKVGRQWVMSGQAVINWRRSVPNHTRFPIRERLQAMRIRQMDEGNREITWAHVEDAVFSGDKEVLEVTLGDGSRVAGSKDHRILTASGWKTIADLVPTDLVRVRRFGTPEDERRDAERLTKIDGRWRSVWQRKMAVKFRSVDSLCRQCRQRAGEDVHHIVPVHVDASLAFDEGNITFLCSKCHRDKHRVQGWQGGTYLYGSLSPVVSVVSRGIEPTYDLSISGAFPNFIANGIVVHNSRNSASSRAIPTAKTMARIADEPAVPLVFAAEQKGMQAGAPLPPEDAARARNVWLAARDAAVTHAEQLAQLGVHKSIVNRLLEPFMSHTVVVSATDYTNFFAQRCTPQQGPPLAQAEIRHVADLMRSALHASLPAQVPVGGWHTPYLFPDERRNLPPETARKVSAARCARVSYLNHNGHRSVAGDLALYQRLVTADPPHASPLEHVATPAVEGEHVVGNFTGWHQLRHPGRDNS